MTAGGPDPGQLVPVLLEWFATAARELPWRSEPTPYRVLLSELMLQQTRVETALPYYERFLERWPRLEDLAAADEDEVLREWAGLGYYSRARNLHRCARAAVSRGGLPSEPGLLRELPGVGPYTAGAVASIAFGTRAPLVDGNVERVLSRIDARSADPRSTAGRRALWARAAELQDALRPDDHPGDLNQALMELGATVCTPRSPSCGACPVRALCAAAAAGSPEAFPVRAPRRKPVPIHGVAGVARVGEAVVLGRRPPGLLGGLWEPILVEVPEEGDRAEALARGFSTRAGLEVQVGPRLTDVTHVFTHRHLTCTVFEVRAPEPCRPTVGDHYTDVALATPDSVALSTLARKILDAAARASSLPLLGPRG